MSQRPYRQNLKPAPLKNGGEPAPRKPTAPAANPSTRSKLLGPALAVGAVLFILAARTYRSNREGIPAQLVSAVSRGDAAETTRLIKAGADVNAVNDRHTPIWYALISCHPRCARILLENGANINTPNANAGAGLLMLLANERFGSLAPELPDRDQQVEQTAVAQLLLQKGADVRATDQNGDTALMWAAAHDHEALVEQLLAAGAPASGRDKLGQSALIYAAAGGSLPIAKTLLAHGAGHSGDLLTAVKIARDLHHSDIVRLLTRKDTAK